MRLYVDTSAFAKLLLAEPGSEHALSIWDEAERIASSRVLYVEARAALAAAERAGRVRGRTADRARGRLEHLAGEVNVVELGAGLSQLAGDLAERHQLRAGDAIHLASAVAIGDPELVVASWDADLRRASQGAGLAITPSRVEPG